MNRYLDLNLPIGQSCFLWGARKTGKTTYLKQKYPTAIFIDLLKSDIFQSYFREPQRLRHEVQHIEKPSIIIIDEVQKVPLLLDEVHWLIENNKNLQFILCGSSSRRLKKSGYNLLGGRAWRMQFVPFCYPELKSLDWDRIFNKGLIPSHYLSKNAERDIASYLYDYVLSEVHAEADIRKRDSFARFIDILGFSQGEMINFTNIARECGVSSHTVKTYFEILEDMYLGYFIYPYRKVVKRQIIKDTPKFYLFDTGVASYLRRFQYKDMLGVETGRAFEHYVFLELQAYKLLNSKRDMINYWRTKEGSEVDFIFSNIALEVKLSDSIHSGDLKGLRVFSREHAHDLHLVCREPRKRTMDLGDKKVNIWPIQEFLEELWAGEFWI
jgi:predicted AAA+ superfamily ATPase